MNQRIKITDPIENIVANALDQAGIKYKSDTEPSDLPPPEEGERRLDFYLSDHDIWIECKRAHSDRTYSQLASQENVILIQGMKAAETFASMITKGIKKEPGRDLSKKN